MTFDEFLLSRVVFEIRYPKGYLFWDKGGALLFKIEQEAPDLVAIKRNKDVYTIANQKLKLEANYNWERLSVDQAGVDNLNQFKKRTDLLWKIIYEELKISEIKRVGTRFWFLSPKASKDTEALLTKAKIFGSKIEAGSIFGSELVTKDFTLIIKDGDIGIRIACGAATRQPDAELDKDEKFLKYNPLEALLVDIDIYTTKIAIDKFVPSEFIQKAYKRIEANLIKLLAEVKK
ncbi:MAG: hypothetical protein WC530_00370 [Candidatus Omnitrophota bacterium]|jgi:hypothetical protein